MLLDVRLESVLTFTKISAEDSGLYSCRELHHGSIGHLINVLVSESNQGNQTDDTNTELKNGQNDGSESDADTMGITSLAYFVTFLCTVLILFTIIAVVMLRTYGCKCKPRHQPNSQDVQPSQNIPPLPKRNPPVLYPSLPLDNDISSASLEPSPNNIRDVRDQGLQETSEDRLSALYSKIDRTKSQKQVANSVVSYELV
uniref:Uncharacterized protein n=1 Tax=Knipowitschia caucasica TaxID=637954 RepID=A0AAV2K285_KNICA